jgi:hypothetical protein
MAELFARAWERARRRHRRYLVLAVTALAPVAALFAVLQLQMGDSRPRVDGEVPPLQQRRELPRRIALARQRAAMEAERQREALRLALLARQRAALQAERIAERRQEEALRVARIARQRHP